MNWVASLAPRPHRLPVEIFDFIIVGAGSAGCVLAERLSASGRFSVLVLEAGPYDSRLWIKLPIGYGRTFYDERINWKYQAAPDPGLDGRVAYWPRGRVVGGSSSINALVYCRGLPHDFDDWREAGALGWGWSDVEPVFDRIESRVDRAGAESGGPLAVADVTDEAHPIKSHFFAAAREFGLSETADFNGAAPEGVGVYAITRRRGLRCSAADAFLRPALKRRNVALRTKAQVARIVIEGDRAAAVEYDIGGAMEMARARFSVILSAGAIGSPQLLQLSGIGPGALLAAHGIKVAADLPAVGGYLQDHLAISYRYKSREPTLNDELASWLGRMRAGLRYVLGRTGPLSLSVNQCGGFVRSRPDAPFPDLQLYFNPLTYTTATDDKRRGGVNPDPFSGFLLSYQPARPVSRGRVNIASANWRHAPHIQPNSLSAPKDIEDVVAGGRLLRALVRTKAMQALIAGPLGPAIEEMDDDALLADFRARSSTVFHPVGACRIGESPHDSVVDPSLKVHGLAGLRVADASVFPSITSANTNAPTIMVGYKAAEIILRDVMNGR